MEDETFFKIFENQISENVETGNFSRTVGLDIGTPQIGSSAIPFDAFSEVITI